VQGHYAPDKGTRIPEQVVRYTYFDWMSIDWHDQLDRNDSDIPDDKFWPEKAKVKKLIYLSARNAPSLAWLSATRYKSHM